MTVMHDTLCFFLLSYRFWLLNVKAKGKVAPMLNQAPRHKDILGEWRYSSTHSSPWQ